MTSIAIVILVIIAVIVILLFWVAGVYNGLVVSRNQYKNSFAQIDVQLKRRYDLIPNLVETAKGYMQHEKGTLEAVMQARAAAMGAGQKIADNPGDASAMKSFAGAEGQLNSALGRLMVVVESYPDLKANQNMLALQEELTSTENKISYARQAYNDSAMNFNNRREQFPNNIIAGIFNFMPASLWEIENQAEKEVPKVSF